MEEANNQAEVPVEYHKRTTQKGFEEDSENDQDERELAAVS